MRSVLTFLCVLSLLAAACASSRTDRVEAALLSDSPPDDFYLAVTVLRPVPLGAIINARTEPERSTVPRPARYVLEADDVLRVAVGYGASETSFPPETRQLTHEQVAALWRELRDSALVDPQHPCRVGRLPELDAFGRETEGRGGYSISFSIEGERRILAIDEAAPAASDARTLVEQLSALAWIRPKPADVQPEPESAAATTTTAPSPKAAP